MSDSDAPTVGIVDGVLEANEFVDRLRRLRRLRDQFDSALVEAFRRRAECARRSDPREAERAARLGLVVAEAIRDRAGRLACLFERAKASVMCGDAAPALDSIEDASRLARELGDDVVLTELDLLRAQVHLAQERYADARASLGRAIAALDARGDVGDARLLAHMTLADLEFRLDRPRRALREHRKVERLLPADASARCRAVLATNRANSLAALGRFRAAARRFDEARRFFAAAGWKHSVAQVDYNAAYAAILRDDLDEATRLHAACEPVFRRAEDVRQLAHLDLDRAQVQLYRGHAEEAAALATSAEVRFLTLGLVKERAQAVYVYARASEIRGDLHTATAWFERAERLFGDLGLEERVVACLVSRGEILEREGDALLARALAQDARRRLDDDMRPTAAARVALLLARLDLAAGDAESAAAAAASVLARGRRCRRFRDAAARVLAEARGRQMGRRAGRRNRTAGATR